MGRSPRWFEGEGPFGIRETPGVSPSKKQGCYHMKDFAIFDF